MTEQEFVDAVMARVSFRRRFRKETRESIERGIRPLFEFDYTVTDAVRTAKCFEEVDTRNSEESQLRTMRLIADKYPKAVAARKQFQP